MRMGSWLFVHKIKLSYAKCIFIGMCILYEFVWLVIYNFMSQRLYIYRLFCFFWYSDKNVAVSSFLEWFQLLALGCLWQCFVFFNFFIHIYIFMHSRDSLKAKKYTKVFGNVVTSVLSIGSCRKYIIKIYSFQLVYT